LPQRWSGDSEKGETTHSMWYYLTIYFFISMAQVLINLLNQVCRTQCFDWHRAVWAMSTDVSSGRKREFAVALWA
jgi:hypothetical protein